MQSERMRANIVVALKSQKSFCQLKTIFVRKIVKNHCASKTALLRPRPQIAVRLAERGGMRDA